VWQVDVMRPKVLQSGCISLRAAISTSTLISTGVIHNLDHLTIEIGLIKLCCFGASNMCSHHRRLLKEKELCHKKSQEHIANNHSGMYI